MYESVVIVGRSNVGKSSLFNRLVERRQSLVLPEAGTTRDRLDAEITWRGKTFTLVDTGGLDPLKTDTYRAAIIGQSEYAQQHASLILFVVDVTVGLTVEDRQIAKKLRTSGKPLMLVVNKCDHAKRRSESVAFNALNMPMQLVSATNGSGTGDLLDAVVEKLKPAKQSSVQPSFTIALLGKPNVGKSSLLNSMLNSERMIVSPTPHTTRDSQDVAVEYTGATITVIDTAGIRRATKAGDDVEQLSVGKSKAALERADIAFLVVDISEPFTSQDKRLGELIEEAGKGICIIANKWDVIPDKDANTIERYKEYVTAFFPHLSWAPIIFVSAHDSLRTRETLLLAKDIFENLNRHITVNALSKFIKKVVARRPPTIGKGTRRPRLLQFEQIATKPPKFEIIIPQKTNLALTYKQYIINSLREYFEFEGTPLTIRVRSKELTKDELQLASPMKKRPTHRRRTIPVKNMWRGR